MRVMSKFYWCTNCPSCRQGRLIIQLRVGEGSLYLHCEECERGWNHPSEASDSEKGFLTLLEDFESDNPTWEQIQAAGWDAFIAGSFEM